MRYFRPAALAVALLAGAGGPVAADQPDRSERQVLATATGDIDRDGIADRVELRRGVGSDGDVDLVLFLSAGGRLKNEPSLYLDGFGYTDFGAQPDQLPTIDADGRLVVTSSTVLGRFKGNESFIIVLKDGVLKVVAYQKVAANGNNDPVTVDSCDVDFLAGKATRNDQAAATPGPAVPLVDWNAQSVPQACRF
jgi:hypothetical protein